MSEMRFPDVVAWILENKNHADLMDDINKFTFQYTTKYREWKEQNGVEE